MIRYFLRKKITIIAMNIKKSCTFAALYIEKSKWRIGFILHIPIIIFTLTKSKTGFCVIKQKQKRKLKYEILSEMAGFFFE